jgi:hypothetical protein
MLASALRSLATRLRLRRRPMTRQALLLLVAQADRRLGRHKRRARLLGSQAHPMSHRPTQAGARIWSSSRWQV